MTRYYVRTWDIDRQEFTPQDGLSEGPYTLMQLRGVSRRLREMSYDGTRSDASVLVWSDAEWGSPS